MIFTLTVLFVLIALGAFVVHIAGGKCPLWVSVLFLILERLVSLWPVR